MSTSSYLDFYSFEEKEYRSKTRFSFHQRGIIEGQNSNIHDNIFHFIRYNGRMLNEIAWLKLSNIDNLHTHNGRPNLGDFYKINTMEICPSIERVFFFCVKRSYQFNKDQYILLDIKTGNEYEFCIDNDGKRFLIDSDGNETEINTILTCNNLKESVRSMISKYENVIHNPLPNIKTYISKPYSAFLTGSFILNFLKFSGFRSVLETELKILSDFCFQKYISKEGNGELGILVIDTEYKYILSVNMSPRTNNFLVFGEIEKNFGKITIHEFNGQNLESNPIRISSYKLFTPIGIWIDIDNVNEDNFYTLTPYKNNKIMDILVKYYSEPNIRIDMLNRKREDLKNLKIISGRFHNYDMLEMADQVYKSVSFRVADKDKFIVKYNNSDNFLDIIDLIDPITDHVFKVKFHSSSDKLLNIDYFIISMSRPKHFTPETDEIRFEVLVDEHGKTCPLIISNSKIGILLSADTFVNIDKIDLKAVIPMNFIGKYDESEEIIDFDDNINYNDEKYPIISRTGPATAHPIISRTGPATAHPIISRNGPATAHPIRSNII